MNARALRLRASAAAGAILFVATRVLRNPSPEFERDGLAGRLDLRLGAWFAAARSAF